MATVRQKLKLGTGLGVTSEEELQELSKAAGRSAPPTSPLEGSVLGANPDQTKMIGTPAQKTSALRLGVQGAASLSDTLRREQTRDVATAEEQGKLERAEGFKSLGGLGDRVQALVEQKTLAATQAQTLPLIAELADSIPAEQRAALEPELAKLRANPNDLTAVANIAKALGITAAKDIGDLSAKVKANIGSTTEQAADVAGQTVANQSATVADLDIQSLGFNDLNELATLLDVDPAELADMTPDSLIKTIQAEVQDDFAAAEALRNKLSDPTIGAAERAEARKQLKEMGATGIKVAESDLDKLADQIENADVVTFNGEELEVGELLDDEYISGLAAAYYNDETGEVQAKLRAEEPEFAKWLDDNQIALEQSVSQIDSAVQELAVINNKNQELVKKTGLSEDILKELFPDFGELTTNEYNVDKYPVLTILSDPRETDKTRQANLLTNIRELNDIDPVSLREVLNMSRNDLIRSGMLDNGDTWKSTKNYLLTQNRLNKADPDDQYSIVDSIFPGKSPEQAQEMVKETILRLSSNLFGDAPYKQELFNLLDRNGNLKTGQALLDAAKALNPPQTVKGMLANPNISISEKLSRIESDFNSKADPTSGTFEKIKPFLGKNSEGGSSLTIKEVQELGRGLSDTELAVLHKDLTKTGQYQNPRASQVLAGYYSNTPGFQETRNVELQSKDKYNDNIKEPADLTNKFSPFINDLERLLNEPSNFINGTAIQRTVAHLNSHLKPWQEHLVDLQKRAARATGIEKLALTRYAKDFQDRLDKLNPSRYSDRIASRPKPTLTIGTPTPAQASKQEDEKAKSSAAREQIVDKNSPLPKGVTVLDTIRYQGTSLQRLSNGAYRRIPG